MMSLAREYIANILSHIPHLIKKALEAASALDIKFILPAHGAAWRGNALTQILDEYLAFATNLHTCKRVSIIYDTMYGSSARVALAIGEGAKDVGAEFEILDMKSCNLTNVAASLY